MQKQIKTLLHTLLSLICLLVLSSTAFALDGTGIENDPFIIGTAAELQSIMEDPYLVSSYKLGNDI